MNSKLIASALIAAAGLASLNAFAAGADGSVEVQTSTASTLSRAEVQAQARTVQQGAVTASALVDGGTVAVAPATSELSRAEVRAEAAQAHASSPAFDNPASGD